MTSSAQPTPTLFEPDDGPAPAAPPPASSPGSAAQIHQGEHPLLDQLETSAADRRRTSARAQRVISVHADQYRWLPDRSVDLVLTDPPFNIARDTNFHTWEGNTLSSYRFDDDKGWDSYTHDQFIGLLEAWASEFQRVLRPGGHFAVFCADEYISHLSEALTGAGLKVRRTIVWRKPNAMPANRKYMPMSACEYIVQGVRPGKDKTFNASPQIDVPTIELEELEQTLLADKAAMVTHQAVRAALAAATLPAGDARPDAAAAVVSAAVAAAANDVARRSTNMYADGTLRGCVPNQVTFNSAGGNRLHPTEKPVALLRYLTALLSRPGDVVLDPFSGSGSAGEAAAGTGRSVVLVERDREFFDRSAARLSAPVSVRYGPPAPDPAAAGG